MYALLLQDWVTLQGTAAVTSLTQSELSWLDMSAFLDLVTWLEVTEITTPGTFYCAVQTSPTKDEALFTAMNDVVTVAATPMAVGVQVGVYLRDTALCPLSHWLRWQILNPGGLVWNMTFRIWVAANQPGGYARPDAGLGETAAASGGPAWTPGGPAPSAPPQPKYGHLPQAHSKQNAPLPRGAADSGARFGGKNPFTPADIVHATGQQRLNPQHSRYLVRSGVQRPLVHYEKPSISAPITKPQK